MEDENRKSSNEKSTTTLGGWTKIEKHQLLKALKANGSHDIKSIAKVIPTKTSDEIKSAIDYYKKKTRKHPIIAERRRKEKISVKSIPRVPLASWTRSLLDSLDYQDLETDTATALRMIAEFENIPSAVCTENIDFREVYHLLANAMDGKTLNDDESIALVLDKCLIETALISKAFIRPSALKFIVENLDISDKEVIPFPKYTDNNELATVLNLASKKNYNPLNIPIEYLKSMS